ncbi:MAG: type I-U CRISPR-associated helicase/endonuclease Cas3, partial [Alicyclobacillus sp.]|nr:type I-U CRISPR-associated helicase/endonuclease Cas3 [Alicyclobacillus sp.]
MSVLLGPEDFATFFRDIHGYDPFPWQVRLAEKVVTTGKWPGTLDLPTGSGKTAVLDIAVFQLALEANRGRERQAPVRIAFVVDRRLVVDDVFTHADKIARRLRASDLPVTRAIAARLNEMAQSDVPLVIQRLRGGVPREGDWARTPAQPTILCSTVDQVGSRLLFRGYGVSDRMKPIHAGLLGADCRIFLDEAHLSEPFRQTLEWVKQYKEPVWREVQDEARPWGFTLLTATPGRAEGDPFTLALEDYEHHIFSIRWNASKPARLVQLERTTKSRATSRGRAEGDDIGAKDASAASELDLRVQAIMKELNRGIACLKESGVAVPAIGIVVNRIGRARAVFNAIKREFADDIYDSILLIGPARAIQRDKLVEGKLKHIRTQAERPIKPLLLVATQCIEVGADIDLDGLISEAAPLDALRQRFGRLNRAGRDIQPYAAIVAAHSDVQPKNDDPVYGKSIQHAWNYLMQHAVESSQTDDVPVIDFGLASFDALMRSAPIPDDALAPKLDAPVLLPAHLDLLSQTSPIPTADPEVGLYLHGPHREPASIAVIWRADIQPGQNAESLRRLFLLVPPRSSEAIELPVSTVRRWLQHREGLDETLADVAVQVSDTELASTATERRVFRWVGDDDGSKWIHPGELRAGDTVIVPSTYGGVDHYGWNPESDAKVCDLGLRANLPFARRHFAVRVAPGLIEP